MRWIILAYLNVSSEAFQCRLGLDLAFWLCFTRIWLASLSLSLSLCLVFVCRWYFFFFSNNSKATFPENSLQEFIFWEKIYIYKGMWERRDWNFQRVKEDTGKGRKAERSRRRRRVNGFWLKEKNFDFAGELRSSSMVTKREEFWGPVTN